MNDPANEVGLLVISRGTALVLLLVYCAYIFFQVCPRILPLTLITLIHVAENPCRTLCSRNPGERGGGRGRGAEDECCRGCLLVSHNELVLLRSLLPLDPFSLLAVTVVTSFCADYCKYSSLLFGEE